MALVNYDVISHGLNQKFRSLPRFSQGVFGLEPTTFHLEWMRELVNPANRKLLFICPPDSAKTTIVGIIYSAWRICSNHNIHIGYVSDTGKQAMRQSLAVRDVIDQDPILRLAYPNLELDEAKGTARNEWFVKRANIGDKDATFRSTGVGGPLLGARLDELIVDDVMDKENSTSKLQRDKVWEWLTTTAFSRVVSGGRIIAIGTRWHEDDAYGRMIAKGFKPIHYKAIQDDGTLLWNRWAWVDIIDKRDTLGARLFSLMYQGVVMENAGGIFQHKWFRYARVINAPAEPTVIVNGESYRVTKVIQSMDTAQKQNEDNSYSVIATWGVFRLGYILLDLWRKKVPFYRLKSAAKTLGEYWCPDLILVEDKSSGSSLIDDLRFETKLKILPWGVDNDKTARAESVTTFFEGGRVFFREDAAYLGDFEPELEAFPNGTHDDQVDTCTQFLHYIRALEKSKKGTVKASS